MAGGAGLGPDPVGPVVLRVPPPHRLMIDLSEVVRVDYGTGIHRVVRNLTRSLLQIGSGHGWHCLPVAHSQDGRLDDAWEYAVQRLGVAPAGDVEQPGFSNKDHLLLLDSAWEHPERFLDTIDSMHIAGAKVGAVLYDLIPLRFPHYCVDFMQAVFEKWLRFVILHCDYVICISRAVADDLKAWIGETQAATSPGLHIGHVLLGSDIGEGGTLEPPDESVREAMRHDDVTLMVGTVEPRKRHDLALQAFERMWDAGSSRRLVIVGKQGWHVEELAARLRRHPRNGSGLVWLENASNSDLEYAYQNCVAVLQASDAEGFGLPIVEASRHGKPLLLSDIPVFREVAGEGANYFIAGDVDSLHGKLLEELVTPRGVAQSDWQHCAISLLGLLQGGPWDHALQA